MTAKTLAALCLISITLTARGEFLACDEANNCCDLKRCENPKAHLIIGSGLKWDGPMTIENIWFKVNTSNQFPGMAGLSGAARTASSRWSRIPFHGKKVFIALHHGGTTNSTTLWPGRRDGQNIIGWTHDAMPPAHTTIYTDYRGLIVEADIAFNYYSPFDNHAPKEMFPNDKHCILNVAMHEFGHFIGFEHLEHNAGDGCPPYKKYAMYSPPSGTYNRHDGETLKCGEKWAAWYLYNRLNTAGNAPSRPTESSTINSEDSLETKLLQNYPDPFNPDTWIPYQLAKEADVTIEIYDEQGHLVRTLSIGKKPKGQYINRNRAAYWDGKNEQGESLPSGLYFYHLKAGDVTSTKRMVIVK